MREDHVIMEHVIFILIKVFARMDGLEKIANSQYVLMNALLMDYALPRDAIAIK
jgi:hypothetical protein